MDGAWLVPCAVPCRVPGVRRETGHDLRLGRTLGDSTGEYEHAVPVPTKGPHPDCHPPALQRVRPPLGPRGIAEDDDRDRLVKG